MSEFVYFCEDVLDGHSIQKCEVAYRSDSGRTGFDADPQGGELLGHILDGAFAWDFEMSALKQYSKQSGPAVAFFTGKRHSSMPVHRVVTYLGSNPSHEVACDEVPFMEDEDVYIEAIKQYLSDGDYAVQWFPDLSAIIYYLHGKNPVEAWCRHCKDIEIATREVRTRDELPVW